jgi:lactoylglutathione lyase
MNDKSSSPINTPQPLGADSFLARTMSVSLTVKDLEKSLAWYHDILGFSIDRKIEREGKLRVVALKAGEARISINQDDGAKGWDRIKGLGFSLQISTTQSVDEIAARIKQRGGKLLSEPADMPWGVRMLKLEDPDGFKLSISMPLAI